jgi:S-disulfanyl-L-cysteine oxidoreductase SoxD
MRSKNLLLLTAILIASASAWAQTEKYEGVGKTATPEEIRARDITVLPSGHGLPPGEGTAKEGAPIYAAQCAMCHGATGKEGGPLAPKLIGDTPWERGPMTSWPFATSVWDYINRAMPRYREGTLTPKQVYAVTAYLLYRSGIIKETDVMNAKTLAALQMPNRDGWVPSNLEDIANLKKRAGRNGQYPGPDPTSSSSSK